MLLARVCVGSEVFTSHGSLRRVFCNFTGAITSIKHVCDTCKRTEIQHLLRKAFEMILVNVAHHC